MNGLGLSADDLAKRRHFIQGGDATLIVEGRWNELWRQKKGLVADTDLSRELRVQLGSFTEPFNLAWAMQETGRKIEYFSANPLAQYVWSYLTGKMAVPNEHLQHPTIPYLAANLDAMTVTRTGQRMYLDAKWLSRADEREVVRYTPQGTHCALVTGCDWWGLSIIAGGKWELVEQAVDPFFAAEYLDKCAAFWRCVETDTEPQDERPMAAPKPTAKLRIVQLDDEFKDAWPNWAGDMLPLIRTFAETDGAAKLHYATREEITKLVPDDVGTLTRGLFSFTRSKAGVATVVMKKGKDEC